jgi:hypothetical protein
LILKTTFLGFLTPSERIFLIWKLISKIRPPELFFTPLIFSWVAFFDRRLIDSDIVFEVGEKYLPDLYYFCD